MISGKLIEGIISIDEISLTPNLDILSNSIPWILCGEKSEHEHFQVYALMMKKLLILS